MRVALFLFELRWSHSFVNRGRGERRAALPKTRARSHERLDCSGQTSFTAGTIMHRSKLPLTAWFPAAHLVTTRLSDYRHDPRVALGPCVLPFRCQGRSQAKSCEASVRMGSTAKPLSIPKRLVCESFGAPKANADFVVGDNERIEDFETNLEPQSVPDRESDVARKHCSGGRKGGSGSEKDWWEHILGVPTVGHIPSVGSVRANFYFRLVFH